MRPNIYPFQMTPKKRCLHAKGFPGGTVVRTHPPMQRTHSIPGLGKMPHATEQLSPWATATEAHVLQPVFYDKREPTAMRSLCTNYNEE